MQPQPPPRASQAELARLLGVSRQAINDLVRRAILSVDADGQINVDDATQALREQVRPSSKTAAALAAVSTAGDASPTPPPIAEPTPTTPPSLPATDDNGLPTSYHVARTLRESEEAHMARLKRREMEGDLIRLSVVESVWSLALAGTREHIMQMRARLAPLLAVETDVFKIEQMLDLEHTKALEFLANVKLPQPGSASTAP